MKEDEKEGKQKEIEEFERKIEKERNYDILIMDEEERRKYKLVFFRRKISIATTSLRQNRQCLSPDTLIDQRDKAEISLL